MMAKAARLNTELKFHELEREKLAVLDKQKDELKRLQIMKELMMQLVVPSILHNLHKYGQVKIHLVAHKTTYLL